MKVYLDLIILTNFLFDFIILYFTSLILKRKVKLYRFVLGAIIGSFTTLILFIRMNSLELFLFKFIISMFMIIITFKYKDIRYTLKNLYYLYLISIILGGFLYFINIQLSSKNEGLIFITNNAKLNIVLSIILSIIILLNYVKNIKDLKINYNKYYDVKIVFKNDIVYNLNGFLDTGNKLIDPYKRRPVILLKENIIKINDNNMLYVPYKTASGSAVMKCIKPDKIYIDGNLCKKKLLIGLIDNISLDGIDCILNERLLEG